jgi:hypothetical protein
MSDDACSWRLRSEFAAIELRLDHAANGPRLAVTDIRSGMTNYFDPLELEALVWVGHDELSPFLAPARRWFSDLDWVDDDE